MMFFIPKSIFNECVSDFPEIKFSLKFLHGSCPDEFH